MSSIASAAVETGLPYGETRNLPPDDSYIFYDFEKIGCHMCPLDIYEGTVQFIDYYRPGYTWKGEPTILHNFWGTVHYNGRAMHVYPWTGWDYINDEPANWVYLIQGNYAGCPIVISEGAINTPYPGTDGVIQIPDGATHVSFLMSADGTTTVTAYDQHDNYIRRETVYSTITRVNGSDSPSTWALVTLDTSGIYSVHIRGGSNMFLIDDLLIGGLNNPTPEPDPTPDPTPDQPTDYLWTAERLKLLIGAPHNPIGFGYEFLSGTFYSAEDIINNPLVVNWDHINKEWVTGEGINNEGAIIWALNRDANIINNLCLNDMSSKDFKVLVEYGDQRPGDVAFIEYDTTDEGSIGYDEIIMFIEPQIDPETGMTEDCIRILEDGGVHYADSKSIHALYGEDLDITPTSLFTVKRMPKTPKGNKKSPYPNIPGKYKI